MCDDKVKVLQAEMLADPDVKHLVCNRTITFMAVLGFSNHSIDDKIKKEFPTVVCDSESGQGWCYVPELMVEQVMKFIAPMCEFVKTTQHDDNHLTVKWPKFD